MNDFKPSKIMSASEVVAEQLYQRRLDKGLKLPEIAAKINIKQEYLEALEKGEYNKLPAGVYGKNFLKEYAIFLGLDYKRLVKDFQSEKNVSPEEKNEGIFPQQIIKKHNFLIFPKVVKNFIIITITLACLFYLGFCLKKIISPPMLEVTEPQDNQLINENFVNVLGKTETEAEITINGELITLEQGENESIFTKKINLKTGLNIITITARKKYGREVIIKRQILVNE
ncbi:MAG: helix-turn-helix domain-containing protein [Patescibacteria group bacterium]